MRSAQPKAGALRFGGTATRARGGTAYVLVGAKLVSGAALTLSAHAVRVFIRTEYVRRGRGRSVEAIVGEVVVSPEHRTLDRY